MHLLCYTEVSKIFSVAECNQVEDALILLRMDRRGLDSIISEQRLLGMYELELLRIGREMDLPVIGKYKQLVQFLQYAIHFFNDIYTFY